MRVVDRWMWLVVWETHRPSGGGRRRQCQRGRRCLTPLRAQDGRADALCARLDGLRRGGGAALARGPGRAAQRARARAGPRSAHGGGLHTPRLSSRCSAAPCANSAHKDPPRARIPRTKTPRANTPRAARRGAGALSAPGRGAARRCARCPARAAGCSRRPRSARGTVLHVGRALAACLAGEAGTQTDGSGASYGAKADAPSAAVCKHRVVQSVLTHGRTEEVLEWLCVPRPPSPSSLLFSLPPNPC